MYSYNRLKSGDNYHRDQPSDDMMINGEYLSELLNGYRQLHVSGRFLIDQDVDITTIPMRAGGWFNYATDKVRTVEIKYQMQADTSEELRDTYAEFNRIIKRGQQDGLLEIRFKDELDWEYRGVFSSSDAPPEQALSFTGSFTLIMPDPYKYGRPQQSSGYITMANADKVLPSKIVVTTQQTPTFSILNGDLEIPFVGSYASGGTVTINFGDDEIKIDYNGRNILSELRWKNDLEVFYLKRGDTITGDKCTIKSVEWRDKRQ